MIGRLLTGRVVAVLAAALLGGALAGWLTWPDDAAAPPTATSAAALQAPAEESSAPDRTRGPRPASRPARTGSADDRAGPRTDARTRTRPRTRTPGVPTRLRVPDLDLSLPVQPEGVDPDGAMALPETVAAAGWYRYGPRPGSQAGAAVIAGHVDTASEGVGPMSELVRLDVGDRVAVDTSRDTRDYTVTSLDVVDRADLDLSRLFARDGAPRLHLVTCGGAYLPEQGGYQSNVVVVAEPTPKARAPRLSSGG